VLVGLALLGGLLSATTGSIGPDGLVAGLLIALLLAVLYIVRRRQVLEFTASGATMTMTTWRLGNLQAQQLLQTAEAAKNARYLRTRPSSGTVTMATP
jgi:hypothetical protein